MKKILFFAVLGALGTATFTSCSNDDAVEVPATPEVKAQDYAQAFKAKFGNSTSFNTVKTVDVQAVLPNGNGNYTLRVYDRYPSAKAQMVGKFENLNAASVANLKVNCPGNATRLFFTAEQNGVSKVTNCGIKNNKVVAKFAGEESQYAGLEGTFNLAFSDEYAQFSQDFYTALPNALTTIAGLFNEGENHQTAGADAFFFFNEDGEVTFYPIFQNETLNDHIGYFIYNTKTGEIVEEGALIDGTRETEFLWQGTAAGPQAVYPYYQKDVQGVKFSGRNNNMYSKAYTVTAPEGADIADLVVGITVSNDPYTNERNYKTGTDYMYGEKYYSISELNTNLTAAGAQVAVYAAGQIEITEETEEGVTTTTGTFGLVGIEDVLLGNSDFDMNDVVFYTEATQATSIVFEKPAIYYVAFEDLGGTYDFDFNDVVLGIGFVSGQETATVSCLAAGGTLPVEVMYQQETLFGEIHEAFGVPTNTVVNTVPEGMEVGLPSAICEPLETTIAIDPEFSVAEDALPFELLVDGAYGQVKISARGEDGTPQALVLGTTWTKYPDTYDEAGEVEETGDYVTEPDFLFWAWPIEKVGIDAAYPDINNWIADPTNFDWLETGVESNLFPIFE